MARYTGPVCRLCRREKMKLFLKGAKCHSMKCPIERRPYPPGEHGRTQLRRKDSEYLVQLREKQKARRIYGVLEKQFRNYYDKATRRQGLTGENLLVMLERRLDNVVFRGGLAVTRPQSRQLVTHRHVRVNGRTVNIPSYQVEPGDVVTIKERSVDIVPVLGAMELASGRQIPGWLSLDQGQRQVSVLNLPTRQQIDVPVAEQLIVELYSK